MVNIIHRKFIILSLAVAAGILPICVSAELSNIVKTSESLYYVTGDDAGKREYVQKISEDRKKYASLYSIKEPEKTKENSTQNIKDKSTKKMNWSLSFFLTGGMKSGRVEEYVFEGKRTISYLDWEINPLIFFGGGMKLQVKPYFFINGSFHAAVNNVAGSMKDYDWDSSGELNKYSFHDNELEKGYFGNINFQWQAVKIKKTDLYLGVGYKINHFEFLAVNGYKEYPPGSDPVSLSGEVVAYTQTSHIPYYMAGISGPFYGTLSWFVYILHSPFVITEATDTHFLTHKQYDDLIIGASFVGIEIGIKWQIDFIVLQVQVSLENTFPFTGSTEITDTQTGYVSPEADGVGAAYMAVTVEVSVIYICF